MKKKEGITVMSQYTHVFLHKGKEFIEVSCTGRSACISEMFRGIAPWEKIRHITTEQLNEIYDDYKGEYTKWEKYLAQLDQKKALVATFNNSVNEKMAQLNDINESIEETKDTMDELRAALARVLWLYEISQDGAATVWVGVECGSDVSEKDDVSLSSDGDESDDEDEDY